MNGVGPVQAHLREVEAFEDLERFEQGRPLRPWAALADGVAPVRDRGRLLDPGDVPGQVVITDQAAIRARPGVDLAGDRAAIEIVGDQTKPPAPIGRRPLGLDQPSDRAREVGVPGLLGPIEDAERRRGGLGERFGSEPVEGGQADVERGGNGRRLDPARRDAARPGEVLARRQLRCRPLAGQDLDDLAAGVVDQDRDLAAEAKLVRIGDALRQDRRHGRVDGVAPVAEHRAADLHRLRASRDDRPVLPRVLPMPDDRAGGPGRPRPCLSLRQARAGDHQQENAERGAGHGGSPEVGGGRSHRASAELIAADGPEQSGSGSIREKRRGSRSSPRDLKPRAVQFPSGSFTMAFASPTFTPACSEG